MWTGLARAWGSSPRENETSARNRSQRRAIVGQYIVASLQDRAPAFFADDLAHGRRVTSAALAFADALLGQRHRFVGERGDDTHALVDNLVAFIAVHEGATAARSRSRYDELVDTWNVGERRAVLDLDPEQSDDDLACDIIDTWTTLVHEKLGAVPGVCMVGRSRRHLPAALYASWLEAAAKHTAASAAHVFDVEYTNDDDDEDLDERAAVQALAPLVDAVARMRATHGDAVQLDWTLNVDCHAAPRIHCSVAYRVTANEDQT